MATRWRWPPESSAGRRAASSAGSATRSMSRRARLGAGPSVADAEVAQRLGDDLGHRLPRIERRERVLVHELHAPPELAFRGAGELRDLRAAELDAACVGRDEPRDDAGRRRLARARLAHDRVGGAAQHPERHVVDRAERLAAASERVRLRESGCHERERVLGRRDARVAQVDRRSRVAGTAARRAPGHPPPADGCRPRPGRRAASRSGRCSTMRPCCMTTMRSARSAATPRSWVTSSTAVPCSRRRSSMRSRMRRCTVTSSALVGSSAITSSGSRATAMAMSTRWRMPPESSCGYWRARSAGSSRPTRSSSSSTRFRMSRRSRWPWMRNVSASCTPIGRTGLSDETGSCGM